jgi:large subunit ribosomal protein L35Ae
MFTDDYPFDSKLNSLYAKGRVLGFKRAKRNQSENTSLLQIEGVKERDGKPHS